MSVNAYALDRLVLRLTSPKPAAPRGGLILFVAFLLHAYLYFSHARGCSSRRASCPRRPESYLEGLYPCEGTCILGSRVCVRLPSRSEGAVSDGTGDSVAIVKVTPVDKWQLLPGARVGVGTEWGRAGPGSRCSCTVGIVVSGRAVMTLGCRIGLWERCWVDNSYYRGLSH